MFDIQDYVHPDSDIVFVVDSSVSRTVIGKNVSTKALPYHDEEMSLYDIPNLTIIHGAVGYAYEHDGISLFPIAFVNSMKKKSANITEFFAYLCVELAPFGQEPEILKHDGTLKINR